MISIINIIVTWWGFEPPVKLNRLQPCGITKVWTWRIMGTLTCSTAHVEHKVDHSFWSLDRNSAKLREIRRTHHQSFKTCSYSLRHACGKDRYHLCNHCNQKLVAILAVFTALTIAAFSLLYTFMHLAVLCIARSCFCQISSGYELWEH